MRSDMRGSRLVCAALALGGVALPEDAASAPNVDGRVTPRLALVIGAAVYDHFEPPRPTMRADAAGVVEVLQEASFRIWSPSNPTYENIVTEIISVRTELERLAQDAIVVVYFGGHGFAANGVDFLVPTSADPGNLLRSSLSLDYVVNSLYPRSGGALLVLVNKCRTPVPSGRTRSVLTGLSPAAPAPPSLPPPDPWVRSRSPAMLLLHFSTLMGAPAKAQLFESDTHSPYGLALLEIAESADLVFDEVLDHVRDRVLQRTIDLTLPQNPNPQPLRGEGEIYLFPSPAITERERLEWEALRSSEDAARLRDYLGSHPDSSQKLNAATRLKELTGGPP